MADPHPTRFPHTPITLTVDEVREALNDRLDEALDGASATAIHAAIDALIAAVRAEQSKGPAGSFGYCPVCYHPLDGCSNCG